MPRTKKSVTKPGGLPTPGPPSSESDAVAPRYGDTPFPVMGIGASGGGLEPLEPFLQHVPAESGMACVIVQHLHLTVQSILEPVALRGLVMVVLAEVERLSDAEPEGKCEHPISHALLARLERELEGARHESPCIQGEMQVPTRGKQWYRVRNMPYRTLDNRISGVVITFTDITASKMLESQLPMAHPGLEAHIATTAFNALAETPPTNTTTSES